MTDDQEAAYRAAEQLAQQLSDVLHVVVSPRGGVYSISEADARWLVQGSPEGGRG